MKIRITYLYTFPIIVLQADIRTDDGYGIATERQNMWHKKQHSLMMRMDDYYDAEEYSEFFDRLKEKYPGAEVILDESIRTQHASIADELERLLSTPN